MKGATSPGDDEAARWLLLIHQLPPKPAYLRVKIWRRLQALGAVTVKNSVYVLPANEQTQEDFEWLLKEICEGHGEGMICEARLVDGLSDQDVRSLFNTARDADYDALAKEARALTETLTGEVTPAVRVDAKAKLARLKASAQQIVAIDFFGANSRLAVNGLITSLERLLQDEETIMPEQKPSASDFGQFTGRTWVTRKGVYVDRIASAWLIRRFIDKDAKFKFVAEKGYVPRTGELRFDMFEGEFTHEGDRCTFEVLMTKASLQDPALAAIAEIVHDIDLKDAKFGRDETSGIAHLVAGLASAQPDDVTRIERGSALFDDLYEYFRKKRT